MFHFTQNLAMFKVCTLLKIPSGITLSMLTSALASTSFVPCGDHQKVSSGFAYPIGTSLSRAFSTGVISCFKSQSRVLPLAVLAEIAQERIERIEIQQGRKLSKIDRKPVVEDVEYDLLPQAFKLTRKIIAFVDITKGLIFIESDNKDVIDAVIVKLNSCNIMTTRATIRGNRSMDMMQWVYNNQTPSGLVMVAGDFVKDKKKYHVTSIADMQNLVNTGGTVEKITFQHNTGVLFTLSKNLVLSGIRYQKIAQPLNLNAESLFDFQATTTLGALIPIVNHFPNWFGFGWS